MTAKQATDLTLALLICSILGYSISSYHSAQPPEPSVVEGPTGGNESIVAAPLSVNFVTRSMSGRQIRRIKGAPCAVSGQDGTLMAHWMYSDGLRLTFPDKPLLEDEHPMMLTGSQVEVCGKVVARKGDAEVTVLAKLRALGLVLDSAFKIDEARGRDDVFNYQGSQVGLNFKAGKLQTVIMSDLVIGTDQPSGPGTIPRRHESPETPCRIP